MGLLFCILLILLGVLGLSTVIVEKVPAAKSAIAKLVEYQEIIGVIGIVLGTLSLFMWLISAHYIFAFPLRILLALAAVLIELALGIIFGLPWLRKNTLKDPAVPFTIKMENLRNRLLPKQRELGFVALVIGVLYLLTGML